MPEKADAEARLECVRAESMRPVPVGAKCPAAPSLRGPEKSRALSPAAESDETAVYGLSKCSKGASE